MALVLKDRVKETTTTTGTGTLTLAGAMSGFQAFSVIGNANTTYYAIYEPSGTDWEVGIGTYTLSGTTLSRDTILASSNAGAAVNFGAGTKIVFCTYPADKSMFLDAADDFSMAGTITTGGASLNGAVVINESGADVDFRVESDTNANALVLDGASGNIGIGTVASPNVRVGLSGDMTGSTDCRGLYVTSQIKSDVTTVARYFLTVATTEAAAFTCSNLRHYSASEGTLGAGSSVTTQVGYYVETNLVGATNNYAFQGGIASGTGRYNLYMNGTASNYMAGDLLLGSTVPYEVNAQSITFTPRLQNNQGSLASAATLTSLWSNIASGPYIMLAKSRGGVGTHTILASGDATGSVSFAGSDGTAFIESARIRAEVDGTPGTNDMPGRLVFYTTADGASIPAERMRIDSNGNVGIGTTSLTGLNLNVSKPITGAVTSQGIFSQGAVQSDVTSNARYFQSTASTQNAVFTLANLAHYSAFQATFGASSTVTNQYGFSVAASLTGATNNYGFYGDIASGTGRWNLYMSGTAQNYLAAGVNIGGVGDGAWIDDSSHGSTSTTMYIGNQSINTTSDYRLKTNIVNTEANALNVINNLRVVDFEWDDPTDTSWNNKNARGKWTGLIAQEAINHIPYVVNAPRNKETMEPIPEYKDCHGNNVYWFIEYQHMVPMLVKAIQELTDRLNALESQN